ncbi:hypothetical protein D9M70_603070 [compost metagenome]
MQQAQFQHPAHQPAALGIGDGLAQAVDRLPALSLGDAQPQAGDGRRIHVIAVHEDARPIPVAEFLDLPERLLGGVQAPFQGGDAGTLHPGGALDA